MSRLLGLDFGTKRTGVAICDAGRRIATSLKTLQMGDEQRAQRELRTIIDEYQPAAIVIGIPYDTRDGSLTQRARWVIQTAQRWQPHFGERPVIGVDERYSSRNNESFLIQSADLSRRRRKNVIDAQAARTILQRYLDSPQGEDLATLVALHHRPHH